MLGLLNKRNITCVLYVWHVAITFICVYFDVRVDQGGCRPGSNLHTEVDFHNRISTFYFFLVSAPNLREHMLGLFNKHNITCALYVWHVAIMFICVKLNVRVHQCGCQPGSNVHTEVDFHIRISNFLLFYGLSTQSA